jgi:transglutaminase-like putative cysteine protease
MGDRVVRGSNGHIRRNASQRIRAPFTMSATADPTSSTPLAGPGSDADTVVATPAATTRPAEPVVPSSPNAPPARIPPAQPSGTDGGRTFEIDCALSYEVNGPTDFLFQIHALDGMDQRVLSESLEVSQNLPVHVYADPTVKHRFLRLHATGGLVELRYLARVQRLPEPVDTAAEQMAIADLPDDLLHNLMPSRYCESDHLSRAAQRIFGSEPPGYARVQAVVEWIHANVEYKVGSSQATTTARDVFVNRAGVCRDFAHLGVTFCRALNIPARLVVGYARFDAPPPDFHAVFEAYLGGRWVLFDPTKMSPLDELVRIAVGRDAKDVAFATIFGPATMIAMSPLVQPVSAG